MGLHRGISSRLMGFLYAGVTLESSHLKPGKTCIPSDIWKGRFSGKEKLLICLHSLCFQFILFTDCDFFVLLSQLKLIETVIFQQISL